MNVVDFIIICFYLIWSSLNPMKICMNCNHEFDSCSWECPNCSHTPNNINGYYVFAPELALENDFYNADDYQEFFNVESAHFWFSARNKLIKGMLKKYCNQNANFLEIGCGTAFVSQYVKNNFKNFNVSCCDIYSSCLNFAKDRLGIANIFQMNILNLPFTSEFDIVGAFDVVEHVEDDLSAFQQVNKSLKPNGHFILTVPHHKFLWSKTDDDAHHKRRYEIADIESKLIAAGFKVIKKTAFVSLLLPIMLVKRLFNNKASELKLNKFLNFFFEFVMQLERYYVMAGGEFKFGGSLIIIAQKL